jgi:ParB family chromosome partitioning protein
MIDEQLSDTILLSSIIITKRTRKDFGYIDSLAESISSIGLLQPIVINENNELVDGQRRIKAFIQLGKTEIPFYRVGEFHANSNRKDFTSSERVTISKAVEKYLREYSRGVGRPRGNQKVDENTAKDNGPSLDSANTDLSKNNVVNLTTFSGRIKDNVSRYLGVTRNTLEKEKKIIEAAEQDPQRFHDLRKKSIRKK